MSEPTAAPSRSRRLLLGAGALLALGANVALFATLGDHQPSVDVAQSRASATQETESAPETDDVPRPIPSISQSDEPRVDPTVIQPDPTLFGDPLPPLDDDQFAAQMQLRAGALTVVGNQDLRSMSQVFCEGADISPDQPEVYAQQILGTFATRSYTSRDLVGFAEVAGARYCPEVSLHDRAQMSDALTLDHGLADLDAYRVGLLPAPASASDEQLRAVAAQSCEQVKGPNISMIISVLHQYLEPMSDQDSILTASWTLSTFCPAGAKELIDDGVQLA